ncbi:hypothetical protein CH63R_10142 [Colletotrichum higginsianum IMI 349063]|uniref:Uncharacterized protein n=1 Tax=Colletotrichum higginsianum (strain IMI 349063) TaxID=759273 RepID=A0A1B7Y219_COLHI|nr:uncharacterized protein CH63R_10142 [Colletotrichum higginsianum IMI 349063]OBR06022.1 hypothetical protein CH63R_10142 [Colletotrichum higginsianum IMI 349063]
MANQTVETAPESPIENVLARDLQIESAVKGGETTREKRSVIGRETSKFRDLRPGPAILVHRTDLSLPLCTASQATQQIHAPNVA